jgi:hypothetical protein
MKRAILLLLATALGARAGSPLDLGLDHLAAKAKESVDITLDATTLQLAGKFLSGASKDEAQAKDLIQGVKAIYVRTFEFAREGEYSAADLRPLRARLQSPGWSRILGAQSKADRESSEIYSRVENGRMAGLVIIATEPKELAVVYIEGAIDLARLAGLAGHFGIPAIPIPSPGKKGSK